MSKTDGKLRALMVQHEAPTPPGVAGEWLAQQDVDVDLYRIDLEDGDVDPRDYGLIVSLGSQFAAFDDSLPWIEREKRLFRGALEVAVLIVGWALGATVGVGTLVFALGIGPLVQFFLNRLELDPVVQDPG